MDDGFIGIIAVAIIILYAGFSIWLVLSRKTVWGSVVATAATLGGSLVIVPIAQTIAFYLFCALVIGVLACGASSSSD